MDEIITSDLTQFGYKELYEAGQLLQAYAADGSDFLYKGVNVFMNKNSGKVFLSDEDMRVGVLEGGRLVEFYSCPECGYEGTQEEAIADNHNFEAHDGYCSKECEEQNK